MTTVGTASIPILDGTNFHIWKLKMKALLMNIDAWDAVELVTFPEERQAEFKNKNRKAYSTLMLGLADDVAINVYEATTSKEVWDTLCRIYEPKDAEIKHTLKNELSNLKKDPTQTMTQHVNKLRKLVQRLAITGYTIPVEDQLTRLFNSLPEEYEVIVSILQMQSDLTFDTAVSHLLRAEEKLKRKIDATESNTKEEVLFSKVVTPKRVSTQTCFYCKKPGHIQRECRKKKFDDKRRKKYNSNHKYKTNSPNFEALAVLEDNDQHDDSWILDSGATRHMTAHKDWIQNYKSIIPQDVYAANNQVMKAVGTGTIRLQATTGRRHVLELKDVLYVPELNRNLISSSLATSRGNLITLTPDKVFIRRGRKTVAQGIMKNGLYHLQCKLLKKDEEKNITCVAETDDTERFNSMESSNQKYHKDATRDMIIHARLGHAKPKNLHAYSEFLGSRTVDTLGDITCDTCSACKAQKMPFKKEATSRATEPLERVHMDLIGPMSHATHSGNKYILIIVDDKTRYIWTYLLKRKNEAFYYFKKMKTFTENHYGKKIKYLRSDNGTEFKSSEFTNYLLNHGITHELSAPYCPQQNGVAERANKSVIQMTRCLLHYANLPFVWWGEALNTAVYTKNRLPHQSVDELCPYSALTGLDPQLDKMRVFGCVAYAVKPKHTWGKFNTRADKCMMLGYKGSSYRLYSLKKKSIIIARDVYFCETQLAVNNEVSHNSGPLLPTPEGNLPVEQERYIHRDERNDHEHKGEDNKHQNAEQENRGEEHEHKDEEHEHEHKDEDHEHEHKDGEHEHEEEQLADIVHEQLDEEAGNGRSRSKRARRPPANIMHWPVITHLTTTTEGEPSCFEEATSCPEANMWEEAMKEELQSMDHNEVYEVTKRPSNRKVVGCKWLYKKKKDQKGNTMRYKARLVAQGYTQQFGIDYNHTYAPVLSYTSLRILLALGATMNLLIEQMDVKTAFLHGNLEEEIYMEIPKGVSHEDDQVWRLKKSIYGLKQSPRQWNARLHEVLTSSGLARCTADPCVYTKRLGHDKLLILGVYVDDLLLLSNNLEDMTDMKKVLQETFTMTDLGPAQRILNINITRDRENRMILLDQAQYIQKMCSKFRLEQAKPAPTPMDTSLLNDASEESPCNAPYRELVGSLLYLSTCTRPDISTSVSIVSRHVQNPTHKHWIMAKRILKYILGTQQYKLLVGGGKELSIYSDADFANDKRTRRSRTGYIVYLGKGAVSWQSHLQSTVALSTAESEYMAITHAVKEGTWIHKLVQDITRKEGKLVMYCDNKSAILIATNPVVNHRSKHIDVRYHFIREKIADNSVILKYVPSDSNPADIMTKPLVRVKFERFRLMLGIVT